MNIKLLIICIVACELIGILGGLSTAGSIDSWYQTLAKPSFNPPGWVFGPVWTTLYAMIGISLYFIIMSKKKAQQKKTAYWVFAIQLFLNAIWTPAFFGVHNILGALIIIILLWIFIVANIFVFYKISKTSAYLLIPYWLWVSFASILNFSLWMLNK